MIYSPSRLSCFERCPLKFRFRYLDKLEPVVEQTIEAFMGSTVHEALRKLYADLRFRKTMTPEEVLAFYNAQWEAGLKPGVLVVKKGRSPEDYRRIGEDCLRNYYGRHFPFGQSKTVGLEQKVALKLDDAGKFRVAGIIDRLAYADGVYEIHDYKTSGSLPHESSLRTDRQLGLYALAVKGSYPNAKGVRLVWHYLSFGLEYPLTKTDEELEMLRRETIALIRKIESSEKFPASPSRLCDWCEFKTACPSMSHAAEVASLPENKLVEDPGVKLVDDYERLSAEKKRIETGLEQVKEALLAFARKRGVDVVAGSGSSAKIWEAEVMRFPGKSEEGRSSLEETLKKAGRWEEVSALDTYSLSKLIEGGVWDEATAEAVRAFGVKQKLSKIYLRKNKA